MAVKKATFNGSIGGSLTTTFACAAARRDLVGQSYATGVPRFGSSVAVPTSEPWTQVIASANTHNVLGSGYDHDGSTALTCLYNTSSGNFTIYRNGDFSSAVATYNLVRGTEVDILDGTDIENSLHAYRPRAAVIVHGAIVMLCEKSELLSGDAVSVSLVMMQASNATATDWREAGQITLIGDIQTLGNGSSYDGHTRVREWSMANYWPDADSTTLTGAWIVGTDYMYNTNPGGSVGGQVVATHIARPGVGSQWTHGGARLVYDSVDEQGARAANFHAHCAGVVVRNATTIDVISAWGDGQANNVTMRHRLVGGPDIRSAYMDATVTHQVGLFGAQGASNPGRPDPQVAGMCPSRTWGNIYCGSDETDALIYEMTIPESTSSTATLRRVYGMPMVAQGDGAAAIVTKQSLWIHSPAPELGGPYVARASSGTSAAGETSNRMVIVSLNGIQWFQAGHYPASMALSAAPVAVGSTKILLPNTSGDGVYTATMPDVTVVRPLMLRKGGAQYAMEQDPAALEVINTDATNEAAASWLTQDADGDWTYSGAKLDPQPPGYGPVRYAEIVEEATPHNALGDFCVTNNWAGTKIVPQNTLVGCRIWCMATGGAGAEIRINHYDGVGDTGKVHTHKIMTTDTWTPVIVLDDPQNDAGSGNHHILLQIDAGTTSTTGIPSKLFIQFDNCVVSDGIPGYSQPFGAVDASGPESALPDEVAPVTGTTLGDDWTVGVAFRVPDECWDTSLGTDLDAGPTETKFIGVQTVPLFSIYKNATNFVDVTADLENEKLIASATIGGAAQTAVEITSAWFNRQDIVKVVVSHDTSGTTTAMSAQIAGPRMHASSDVEVHSASAATAAWSSNQPDTIKFALNDDSESAQIDLIGVYVDNAVAADADARKALIQGTALVEPDGNATHASTRGGSAYTGTGGVFWG